MAVAFESDGGNAWSNANNNNAIALTLPATRPVGALLLCIIHHKLITASVTTAPSGFTLISTLTSGTAGGGRIWVYGRIVDGTETNPSIACDGATGTSGEEWGGYVACYSGVDTSAFPGTPTSVLDGTPTTRDAAETTTCTYPALSIAAADSFVVRFGRRQQDLAVTFTPTGTWDEREDSSTTSRTGGQFHLQDKQATASGSQASVTIAPSSTTSSRWLGVTIALKTRAAVPYTETPADNASASDSIFPSLGIHRTLGDTPSASDTFSRAVAAARAFDDQAAVSDSATPNLTPGGGGPQPFPLEIHLAL